MTNRSYRLLIGSLLLIFLYFDIHNGVYLLILLMFLEGVSNYLLPDLINRFIPVAVGNGNNLAPVQNLTRFSFSAERAWRLIVSLLLTFSYIIFDPQLNLLPENIITPLADVSWFFPWFMGLAILGAGFSAVCPVLILVKWMGFK